jgi:hypothetical protein
MKHAVDCVWWRTVQVGEFFNIERAPTTVEGGGGARYIEIPASLVPETQEFLGVQPTAEGPTEATIVVNTVGDPNIQAPLDFTRKAGGRLRIANQNRQATPESRHPAWRNDRGFPMAPDEVASRQDAAPFYPLGGLRIYIAKTMDGLYIAGFTSGDAPDAIPPDSPTRYLYQDGIGGLIRKSD